MLPSIDVWKNVVKAPTVKMLATKKSNNLVMIIANHRLFKFVEGWLLYVLSSEIFSFIFIV